MKKILVIYAHPAHYKSRVNRALLNALVPLNGVTVHDLYDTYPDFHIDIQQEQELLIEHDIIVWQHPLYWYSSPSVLKEWIDLVFEHNFAFGSKGNALEGKCIFSAITTGGNIRAYKPSGINKHTLKDYLLPFEQTAVMSKMEYLPPFAVHHTHDLSDREIEKEAYSYRKLLEHMRDTLFDKTVMKSFDYLNDYIKELIF